nr:hypothetical protein B0A51_09032 [Rachicladosporium sp. CCFEE 5018]
MSTPTPSHLPSQPLSASKRAAQHVSTPSNLSYTSPAPRSVPSPAALRKDQAGKTPVNHPTTGSSQGSKTLAGTPMLQSLSQQGSSASPSAGMMAFETPAGMGSGLSGLGLGMEMGTPGLAGLTPSMGAAMIPTMSELGLMGSGREKRNEDDERKVKLRKVLKRIGKARGRVSEEGIARVARRAGFALEYSEERSRVKGRETAAVTRTIDIAGKVVMVEVKLEGEEVQSVNVTTSGNSKELERHNESASAVLMQDLKPVDRLDPGLGVSLGPFASNLDWMARLDCGSEKVNCFDALNGLYSSLHRLYEYEIGHATGIETAGSSVADHVMNTTCKRSGRPRFNASGRLGLAIEYWRDERTIAPSQADDSTMDVDAAGSHSNGAQDESSAYNLNLGVERSAPDIYMPIRVSDSWLADPSAMDAATVLGGISWEEPPPTLLTEGSDPDAMVLDAAQRLPHLRFVATFDPPIIVPFTTAVNIHTAVGAAPPQAFANLTTWTSLLLGANVDVPPVIHSALAFSDGVESEVQHQYNLHVAKPDFGYRLEQLPFSHPRQLVELLPTFRQWACMGNLLKQIFTGVATTEPAGGNVARGVEISLDDLTNNSPTTSDSVVPIDITLVTTPTPTLGLNVPYVHPNKLGARITLAVLPNGDFNVSVASATITKSQSIQGQRLAHGLDQCSDLGVWIEWLRAEIAH